MELSTPSQGNADEVAGAGGGVLLQIWREEAAWLKTVCVLMPCRGNEVWPQAAQHIQVEVAGGRLCTDLQEVTRLQVK